MKRLYRSHQNRVIAGVAGGLSDYLNIDPLVIRLIFAFLAIFGGSGILLYLLMWIFVPQNEVQY
ncbi:MAG: PspC domain-containing protein [Bacteroidales bacterium]